MQDVQHDTLLEMVTDILEEALKDIYTMMPGIIEKYDPATRRCSVRPAHRVVFADDTEVQRPILHNVPVVWPRGKYGSIHFRLEKDDAVEICFSMRDLTDFKKSHAVSTPGETPLFAMKDAVVRAGFGPVSEIDPETDGDAWQTDDKQRRIVMDDDVIRIQNEGTKTIVRRDGVEIVSPDGDVDATVTGNVNMTVDGDVAVDATGAVRIISPIGTLTHRGVNVGSNHTHDFTAPLHPGPTQQTGPPQ